MSNTTLCTISDLCEEVFQSAHFLLIQVVCGAVHLLEQIGEIYLINLNNKNNQKQRVGSSLP